ncbi:MAG: hypothetical protein U0326_08295 [Polyangiales bacterium]
MSRSTAVKPKRDSPPTASPRQTRPAPTFHTLTRPSLAGVTDVGESPLRLGRETPGA